MGGLNAAINAATGTDPAAYFNDMRNTVNPEIVGADEAIWTEARTTLLNPKYITALQEGGSSSAEVFAETFRNTFGWNALKPASIDSALWDRLDEVYVDDIHQLEMRAYFEEKNPYAYQELTAVMLETVRKGYWNPDDATIEKIAQIHAELVRDHDPGCSGFVCDNGKLREFIAQRVDSALETAYEDAIEQVRTGSTSEAVEGMRLEKQTDTLDKLAETVRENRTPLLAATVLLLAAMALIIVGIRRRSRST
jgi:cobaltochelatase CobN